MPKAKTADTRKSIHIGQPELYQRWTMYREQFKSADACLEHVLTLAEHSQPQPEATNGSRDGLETILTLLDFDASERELVRDALASSVLPWQHLFKVGLLAKMRATSASYTAPSLDDVDVTDAKASRYVRGASELRCRQALDRLMSANDAATSQAGKRYITNLTLAQEGHCSPNFARSFYEAHADEIKAHHEAHGFTSSEQGRKHNQWVYKGRIGNPVMA